MLQQYAQYSAPLWAGTLPTKVGEPAGGSLTADEYKFAITGPFAIAVAMHNYFIPYGSHVW